VVNALRGSQQGRSVGAFSASGACAQDQMSMSDPATQRHVKQQRVAREELAEQPLRDSTSPPDDAQPLRDSTPPPDNAPRSPSELTGGSHSRDPPMALPGNKRTKRGHYKYENDFEAKQARLAQRRECQARKKAAVLLAGWPTVE
jgi:hypothetical protein